MAKLSRAKGFRPGLPHALAWPCYLHPSLQTPPRPSPIILHPDFRTSLLKDARKSGAGWRRRGEGLGAHHDGGLGTGRVSLPSPLRPHLGTVADGGFRGEGNPWNLKWVPNFNDDKDGADVIQVAPLEIPWDTKAWPVIFDNKNWKKKKPPKISSVENHFQNKMFFFSKN